MSKRFAFVSSAVACAAALLVACAGNNEGQTEQPGTEGAMQVSVQGLSAYQIQSMVITAQPANVSRTLTYTGGDAGTFVGTLVLPVGTQTLTANGYAYVTPGGGADAGPAQDAGIGVDGGPNPPPRSDGGSSTGLTLVASGTATVDIVANTTSAVAMNIYDLTPPVPQPDIGPMIRSATSTAATVFVNQPITLSVDALDLNGDPLTYAWTSDCPSSQFSAPSSSFTQWASPEATGCRLTVTVSSRGLSTSMSLNVTVYSNGGPDGGTGGAQVTGNYIPRPEVYAISAYSSTYLPYTSVSRYGSSANLPLLRSGTSYEVSAYVEYGTHLGNRAASLSASCGTLQLAYDGCSSSPTTSCYIQYTWTTPPAGNVCQLSATASNSGLTDSFNVGVPVR
jgi:hypothetical protein